jgi:hypothetical protein
VNFPKFVPAEELVWCNGKGSYLPVAVAKDKGERKAFSLSLAPENLRFTRAIIVALICHNDGVASTSHILAVRKAVYIWPYSFFKSRRDIH